MSRYKFEIQSCIMVEVEGNSKEEARTKIVDRLDHYKDIMMDNCRISKGEKQ